MARQMADCRRFESENHCSLTIIGEKDEVMSAALQHTVSAHGHQDIPELREQLAACSRTRTAISRVPDRHRRFQAERL